jgi:hypothetical protein
LPLQFSPFRFERAVVGSYAKFHALRALSCMLGLRQPPKSYVSYVASLPNPYAAADFFVPSRDPRKRMAVMQCAFMVVLSLRLSTLPGQFLSAQNAFVRGRSIFSRCQSNEHVGVVVRNAFTLTLSPMAKAHVSSFQINKGFCYRLANELNGEGVITDVPIFVNVAPGWEIAPADDPNVEIFAARSILTNSYAVLADGSAIGPPKHGFPPQVNQQLGYGHHHHHRIPPNSLKFIWKGRKVGLLRTATFPRGQIVQNLSPPFIRSENARIACIESDIEVLKEVPDRIAEVFECIENDIEVLKGTNVKGGLGGFNRGSRYVFNSPFSSGGCKYQSSSDGLNCRNRGSTGTSYGFNSPFSSGGFNQVSSGGFNQVSSGGFNQVSSGGFNQVSSGGFNQGSSGGFNQGSSGGFNQGSSVGFNQGSSVGFNQGSSGGFNQVSSGGFNQVSSVDFNQGSSFGFFLLLRKRA